MTLAEALIEAGPGGMIRHPTLNTFRTDESGKIFIVYQAGKWIKPQGKSFSIEAIIAVADWEVFTGESESEFFLAV